MRYIKTYNESSNNVYYQEISSDEFHKYIGKSRDGNTLRFNDSEFNLLDELDRDDFFERYGETNWNYVYFIMFAYPYKLKGDVYKVDDEWFLVRFDIYDGQSKDILLSLCSYYYKCDQMDGLIYFLRKLKEEGGLVSQLMDREQLWRGR